jgi:hypothetical protein
MILDLDTEVRFLSGERAGFLRKVVLNERNEVTEVVVETTELISRRVIVPIAMLSEGPGGVTYVTCTPEEFADLEDFTEEQVPVLPERPDMPDTASAMGEVFPASTYLPTVPVMDVPNLPEGWTSVSQQTELWCLDERWGILDHVVIDDTGQPSGVIGRPDDIEMHKRLIPMELVRDVAPDRIVLNCSYDELFASSQKITEGIGEPEEA